MNPSTPIEKVEIEQGTPEWHALRKLKITATDANIIMGVSHWKTRTQLYYEKQSNDPPTPPNERMQRGIDLEPIARDLFNEKTGWEMKPAVLVKDWMMASLDGLEKYGNYILEIKCPGQKDHDTALLGKVPDHYYPQIQHQIFVAGIEKGFYYSFDGVDGVIVEVKRDDAYIEKMLFEEKKFYACLMNGTPPEPEEEKYVLRDDTLWTLYAERLIYVRNAIKEFEKQEEELTNQLIFISGESNTKGGGIALYQIQRKGTVDYAKIPALKGVDLDQYRKASINSWRISCV